MASAAPSSWADSAGVLHATQALAEAADRYYAADVLLQAALDDERDSLVYNSLDDLIADRATLEAIFTALDP